MKVIQDMVVVADLVYQGVIVGTQETTLSVSHIVQSVTVSADGTANAVVVSEMQDGTRVAVRNTTFSTSGSNDIIRSAYSAIMQDNQFAGSSMVV